MSSDRAYLQVDLIVGPERAIDLVERDVVVGQCVQQLGYHRHFVLIRKLMIVAHPGCGTGSRVLGPRLPKWPGGS